MLMLGSRSITVEGITIFADHADPDQFWYLPGPVQLAKQPDGSQAFTFIKYKPAAVAAGVKGGGFLTFQVDLRLDPDLERRILSRLRSLADRKPRLTAVPFDEGTVQAIAMDLQGSGGTKAEPAPEGAFRAVEQILGATVPSLQGDNTAAFSLTLSQEGATIVEQALEQGTSPVGVLYDLKFTGMRPALHVEITADLERVYNQFSAGLEAQVYFVKAGIDAAFEKLVQEGAIKINVVDFIGAADMAEKETWALEFFKENLLSTWFEPTLTPGQVSGGRVEPESLSAVLQRGDALRPPKSPAPPPPSETAAPSQPSSKEETTTAKLSETAAPPQPKSKEEPPAAKTGSPDAHEGYNPTPPAADTPDSVPPGEGTGMPPVSSTPAPAAAVGVKTAAPTPGTATMPPAGLSQQSGGPGAVVSFKLRYVRQEERKKITLRYDRSEATQRTYAPQGFFGVLVAGLNRERHFVEVDLDDPFFRVFQISVDPPEDFAALGLRSAHVSLDYGDVKNPAELKHKELLFDASNAGQTQTMEVFLNRNFDLDYRASVQYHFSATSEWEGAAYSYEVAPFTTEDRSLVLVPHEHIGFLTVDVVAAKVDWGVVDSVDVFLRHESGGAVLDKQLVLTHDADRATWKIRTASPADRTYTWRAVHHLTDGSTREIASVEPTRATLLPIDDPFPGAIAMTLFPALDPALTKMAFVDVVYDDPANNYRREERIKITPADVDPIELTYAVLDLTKKSWSYTVTLMSTANKVIKLAPVEAASGDIVVISESPTTSSTF